MRTDSDARAPAAGDAADAVWLKHSCDDEEWDSPPTWSATLWGNRKLTFTLQLPFNIQNFMFI